MKNQLFFKNLILIAIGLFLTVPLCSGQGNMQGRVIPDYIKKTKAFKRAEWFHNQRAYPYDTIPLIHYAGEMQRVTGKAKAKSNTGDAYPVWTSVGPAGFPYVIPEWGAVSGRVRAIAVHPNDPLTVYIGAANGGIWKTTDGGNIWQDIGAGLASLSFGAIAIDPVNPNIVYAGSGECNLLEDFNTYVGSGLLKSMDGGQTWSVITNGFGSYTFFSDLEVSPYNSNVVIASLGGGTAFAGGNLSNEGVWKSQDGGITWVRILDVPDAFDVAFHPNDPTMVYAAAGGYFSPVKGFYISSNQGNTWTQSNTGLLLPINGGRIQFDISHSNPNTIYAVIYDFNNGVGATYAFKSANGGNSWFQISATTPLGGYNNGWYDQGWYDLCIAVDPTDPDHVLIGNVELHRTTTGSTFAPVRPFGNNLWGGLVHCDIHKLIFAPSNPNYLYIGCDGGIYKSTDKGYSASSQNAGLATLQFYRIASHPFNPQIMMGGMQDNSTAMTTNGGSTWNFITGSDGMECMFSPNPDTLYTSAQTGMLYRSTNGGTTFTDMAYIGGAWTTPFIMHPVNHKTLYSANKRILRSNNAGVSFQVISGALAVSPHNITTLAQSKVNPSNMIFGTGMDSPPIDTAFLVKISTDEGATWTDVTANIPAERRWVSRVVADPVDAETMYVVRTGFSLGNKVWKTGNLGQTWTNISGDLPDLPCNDLFVDPENTSNLYLATDLGVYYSLNGGTNWSFGNEGMPFVPALDFSYAKINSVRYLRVGTHGRSIYETQLGFGVGMPEPKSPGISSSIGPVRNFPNPSSSVTTIEYELRDPGKIEVAIYNHFGQKVESLFEGFQQTGKQKVLCDLSTLPAGVYFCRLQSGSDVVTRKIVAVK